LCRKNDGHLIRVTGPSFDLVSGWARRGIPIKVAFKGIDRHFERYYRRGPRRRPVRIDFCEADVLDAFDEWRRAVDITPVAGGQSPVVSQATNDIVAVRSRQRSLPGHLKRVVLRLTSARAGSLPPSFDAVIDQVAAELDRVRQTHLRGPGRQAVIDRLAVLDRELLQQARAVLDDDARSALSREADGDLAPFRATMSLEAFVRAREGAIDRLVRERYNLPVIAYGLL
jgi:hypothetical protein